MTTQRLGSLSRLCIIPETSWNQDPGAPVSHVLPLSGQGGFKTDQALIEAPIFTGTRFPFGVVTGNTTAAGRIPLQLEFNTMARIFRRFFGSGGYSRPGSGKLHRFKIPTDNSGPESFQLEAQFLEATPVYVRAKGCYAGSIGLQYSTEGVAGYDLEVMGSGAEAYTTLDATPEDDGYSAVSYFNGFAKLNQLGLVGLTEFSANLDGGLSRQDVAFNGGIAGGINSGAINARGRLGLTFRTTGAGAEDDLYYYMLAVNNTEVEIECVWTDLPPDIATKFLRFRGIATRFSRSAPQPGGAAGLIIGQDWQIIRSTAADIKPEIFGTILGPYNIGAATDQFAAKIDGVAKTVTLTNGAARTAAQIVAELNADAPFFAVAEADVFLGRVRIKSRTAGTGGSVQFDTAVADHCGAVLGFHNAVITGDNDTPLVIEVYNDINAAIA